MGIALTVLLLLVTFAGIALVFWLPAIVAVSRSHPKAWAIWSILLVLPVVLTLAIWLPAMVEGGLRHLGRGAMNIRLNSFFFGNAGIWLGALIWSVLPIKEAARREPSRALNIALVASWIGGVMTEWLIFYQFSTHLAG
jgi:hypothetical protein